MKFAPFLLCCLLLLASATEGRGQGAQLPQGTKYVMSHFKADGSGGDERLYISISPDGLNWTALNNGNPVYQPANWPASVLRDPSIIYNNGFWWVAYTSGNYGSHASFGLVKSPDLINWTFVGEIDATVPGAPAQYGASYDPLTWSPIFYRDSDCSVHIFVNINPTGGATFNPNPMHPYELHPTSADWTQWSAPLLVTLNNSSTNEFYVWKTGAVYNAIYVSFNQGQAWVYATSNNLLTGWTDVRTLTGYNTQEGGMIIPQSNGANRFYLEPGNDVSPGGYKWCDSFDQLVTFTAQQQVNATVPMRNGKMISDFPESQFAQSAPALSRPWLAALGALLFAATARRHSQIANRRS